MSLNSPLFILFLTLVLAGYYLLPRKLRNPFLLIASYVFYMWKLPYYGALVLGTTAFAYFAAIKLGGAVTEKSKKRRLTLSIIVLLGALFFFKYFNLLSGVAASLGIGVPENGFSLVQPLGISFYTLQLIGYFIDIYRGDASPERDFVTFSLFVSFFPQIISGPINRAGELIPQFREQHDYDYTVVVTGAQRFLTGCLKKLVVADGLALFINGVWDNLAETGGWTLLTVVAAYAIQIYCDFSGYTDMAIGVAEMLGFKLRENFRAPYLAAGITDFWSRWHMSLTSWLRDYVYIPLGGNRKGFARKLINILLVFLVSGLWHGVGVTFLVWGAWHGVLRICDELLTHAFGERFAKPRGALRVARIVISDILVALGWVFFRAPSLAHAGYLFSNLFKFGPFADTVALLQKYAAKGIFTDSRYMWFYFIGIVFGLVLTIIFDILSSRPTRMGQTDFNPLGTFGKKTRWALYWTMGAAVIIFYMISVTGTVSSSLIYQGF
ncbi:MAG: MBOAT family O-acyltransferase [Oscillospiraceae bacterium]